MGGGAFLYEGTQGARGDLGALEDTVSPVRKRGVSILQKNATEEPIAKRSAPIVAAIPNPPAQSLTVKASR